MNFDALAAYLNQTPLLWIIITISVYKISIIIYEKFGKNPLLQPLIVACVIILLILFFAKVPFEEYFKSVNILNFFLGPATVALAVLLYRNLRLIKSFLMPILVTLIVGGIFTTSLAVGILWLLGGSEVTMLSMTTKSVTAPITVVIANDIGSNASLAIGFVAITGVLGASFCGFLFKILKIKHDESKGFALGLVAHAVGVSKAYEISEKAAAFGAVAMSLMGIFIAILLPIIIHHI
ncbi:MAG: LrgB family protein [Campylobacteraceae bacterium]